MPDAEPKLLALDGSLSLLSPSPNPIMFDDEKPVLMGSGVILNDGLWALYQLEHVAEEMEYASGRNGLGNS